jgi:hypothetical protein
MKIRNLIFGGILSLSGVLISCNSFLDQIPQDYVSSAVYFKTPAQFQAAANALHTNVYGWGGNNTFAINFDNGSDISGYTTAEASGTNVVGTDDGYYNQAYSWLRQINILIGKSKSYKTPSEIAAPVGQAYFFRAWQHFFLLKRFGGVAISNYVPDVSSGLLNAPRASRYQVMDQIVNDLDSAILLLNSANVTKATTNNDGHVTLEAAKAFKARVCLFEGTWEKYVGTSTDGDGKTSGAGSVGYSPTKYTEYLNMAKSLSKEIIDGGKFSLWNGVASATVGSVANKAMYANTSYYYLFNLEDAASNPNALTKASNNEPIYRSVYDFTYRKGNTNLTHSAPATPSRKYMDMCLCTDGLPVQYSPLFHGYATLTSEYDNRDYRLTSCIKKPGAWYWGYSTTGANYAADITALPAVTYRYYPTLGGGGGYTSRKFCSENSARADYTESPDYYQIRYAEILLIYAEATAELNGGDVSDADLNYSVNLIRARSGVAPLTHALIAPYPALTILGEIRRERAIELEGEGYRISDLCRWGIAEQEMSGKPTCGVYLTYGGVNTEYSTATNPNTGKPVLTPGAYSATTIVQADFQQSSYAGISPVKAGAVISEVANNRIFVRKNYLQPIGTNQIALNPSLKQNPSW